MKDGDLVKYKDCVVGWNDMIGLIVSWNGSMPIVLWNTGRKEITPTDLLEVINESR